MEVFIVKSFNNQYFITDNLYHKPAFISFNNADFLVHSEILTLDIPACTSENKYLSEAENIKQEFRYKIPYITNITENKTSQSFIFPLQ